MSENRKKKPEIIFENVEITGCGAEGKAIARAEDGRVIFVSGAVEGDVADLRVTRKKSKFYEAVPVRFSKYSDKRADPPCDYFGVCGGCKWQNLKYEYQLLYKQQEVENNLRRLGGLDLPEVSPIIGSKEQYFYRNKLEFSFSSKRWLSPSEMASGEEIRDRSGVGFHVAGMWDKVLDVKKCYLQADPSNAIRNEIRRYAKEHGLEFFDARSQQGFLRTMMIRTSSLGQVMVLIQFFREDKPLREALLNHIKDTFPQIASLLYAINPKCNDSLYDLDIQLFAGRDHFFEEMEGLKFRIGPKSFYQTNSEQALRLYTVAREFAAPRPEETVYDLYTGTGTIAQFVARGAKKVVGIEAVPEAIEAANENALRNGIDNCSFFTGDMKDIFTDEFVAQNGRPDVIITDPPREGMHKNVVEQILRLAPERVVYVSCNSATQARDLAMMKQAYEIRRVQPVDMFPQTHHVENVVLLHRK